MAQIHKQKGGFKPSYLLRNKTKTKKLKWLRTQKHSDTEDSFQSRYSKASNLQGGE